MNHRFLEYLERSRLYFCKKKLLIKGKLKLGNLYFEEILVCIKYIN